MKFIDEVTITVISGHGGPGCVSFRRESMSPRGGPDGGDGGRGGHVILRVNEQLNSLLDYRFKKTFAAANGAPGSGSNMTGADGPDLVLEVPPGTVIRDKDNRVVLDLDRPGDHVFLKGGRGGKGNSFFKTSVNQAPDRAQPGEPGERKEIMLELKLIADVGVIGFPNAGKSTFISRISAARPKIADYPFTTLTPNLGVVKIDSEKTFVVADIPGLVPGAHTGVGLGIQFLRHIERTNLFVHLLDGIQASGRSALEDFRAVMHELEEYDKAKAETDGYRPLLKRQQIVAINKSDAISAADRERLKYQFEQEGQEIRFISAVSGEGIEKLVYDMGRSVFESEQ